MSLSIGGGGVGFCIAEYVENGWAKTQTDFARRCGLHPSVLSRWITGDVWPSADTIAAVEAAVHAPMWPYKRHRRGEGSSRVVVTTTRS